VNRIPGVNDVLGLVDQLKALIQDFAAREEKLESDLRRSRDQAGTRTAPHRE